MFLGVVLCFDMIPLLNYIHALLLNRSAEFGKYAIFVKSSIHRMEAMADGLSVNVTP